MRNAGLCIAGVIGGALIICMVGLGLAHSEPRWDGHSASYWVRQLDNTSDPDREKAVTAVRELGPAAIPYLTVAPRPEDTRLKHVGESLYRLMAPHLSREMKKRLPFRPPGGMIVGSGCATALGSMGPKARSAVPTLLKWLDDPDANICNSAFIALLEIAPDDPHVVNALLQKVKTTTGFTRIMLLGNPANIYDEINPRAVAVIPLLVYGLESENLYARGRAAAALGRFGSAAEQFKPALEAALKDPNMRVRTEAAIGLWRLDGRLDASLRTLNQALESRDARWDAVAGLAEIGAPAKDSVPFLVPLLEDTNRDFSFAVSNAIRKIEPTGAEEIFRKELLPR